MPSAPAERLAYSCWLSQQEAALAPAIHRLTELRRQGLTGPMIVGDFVRRGIAPLKHRHRPLWELNQVCGSVPRRKYHMTMVHLTTCMTFLQPGTNHVMKEGIVPLVEDSLADEV